jgi:hypothetical protein
VRQLRHEAVLRAAAERHGLTPAEIALAWLLRTGKTRLRHRTMARWCSLWDCPARQEHRRRHVRGRGYARLNRDDAGGSLRGLLPDLQRLVEEGQSRIVLDNTYISRAHARGWCKPPTPWGFACAACG